MFSFAGVVKVLYDNNISRWAFSDSNTELEVSECNDSEHNNAVKPSIVEERTDAVDTCSGQCKESIANQSPILGRDRWLKNACVSEDELSDSNGGIATSPIDKEPPTVPEMISITDIPKPDDAKTVTVASDLILETSDNSAASIPHSLSDISSSKKKKKKKSRNRSNSATSNSSATRRVSWGHVDEISFGRSMSFDRIPSDGTYPLGLGEEVSRRQITVEEKTNMQQTELIQRAMKMGVPLDGFKSTSSGNDEVSLLESRQYDYKSGKNPLFSRLSEKDRYCVIVNICIM